jgi:hypothetical protein
MPSVTERSFGALDTTTAAKIIISVSKISAHAKFMKNVLLLSSTVAATQKDVSESNFSV